MVDLLCDLSNMLLNHLTLLSQSEITIVLCVLLLLDRMQSKFMLCKLCLCMVELLLVTRNITVGLFEFALNLAATLLDTFNLSLLTLNVRLDLGHLVVQLV